VVQGVVPDQANENGLTAALKSLCVGMTALYGVRCTFVYKTGVSNRTTDI